MTEHQSFADLWDELENDYVFRTEKNILDFTIRLSQLMKDRGVTKKELAERLDTSQAYITKVLRGNTNFTMASMTKLVQALDAKLDIQIVPKEEKVESWFKALRNDQQTKSNPMKITPEITGNPVPGEEEMEAA